MAQDPPNVREELSQSIDTLAQLVTASETTESTINQIAELAVAAIDPLEVCSVSLAKDGKITTVGATDPMATHLDEIQYGVGEGPCLSSIANHATFYIPDMATDETWPTFSRRAAEKTGVASLLAYVLRVDDSSLGAVNMMSTKTGAFDTDDRAAGSLFAAQAGVALANALTHESDQTKIAQLEEAVETRTVIGEAIGLLMASRKCDKDEAFQVLTELSQRSNTKVREIAVRLVEAAPEILS
ncbi:MAG: GAF and ANTAR domain-containing protein [Actinomycetota bacterium]